MFNEIEYENHLLTERKSEAAIAQSLETIREFFEIMKKLIDNKTHDFTLDVAEKTIKTFLNCGVVESHRRVEALSRYVD